MGNVNLPQLDLFNLVASGHPKSQKVDWKQQIVNYVPAWGLYTVITVVLVWTAELMMKLLTVLSARNQGLTWRTKLRSTANLSG